MKRISLILEVDMGWYLNEDSSRSCESWEETLFQSDIQIQDTRIINVWVTDTRETTKEDY